MNAAAAYIDALNRELGTQFALSESGALTFDLDGRAALMQWSEARQGFLIYVEIGGLLGWRDAEVMKHLLAANFLFMASDGGALSLDPATSRAGLNFFLPIYGLDPEAFVKRLDAALLAADRWAEKLAQICEAEERLAVKESGPDASVPAGVREASAAPARQAAPVDPFGQDYFGMLAV